MGICRMWMVLVFALLAFANAEDSVKAILEDVVHGNPNIDLAADPDELERTLPTAEQLLAMLDSMSGISEADKASLREDLLQNIEKRSIPGSVPPQQLPPVTPPPAEASNIPLETLILFSLLGVVVLIFVFFGYKLFKCLSERESKREEKKKNKQMKKKK